MTTTDPPTAQPDRRGGVPAPDASPYRGQVVAVGTRHGKQNQFADPFAEILGARLCTPADLDTDLFGTFTGERPRPGGSLDAARAKARLALEVTGLTCALASEASYGPLPVTGVSGHEEILLFCDVTRGIEVVEGYRTAEVPGHAEQVGDPGEVSATLLAGLPGQALTVRPAAVGGAGRGAIVKGITDTAALRAALAAAIAASPDGQAVVEPDLRAHHNPSRRRVLRRLGRAMARRLATCCPACGTPGFGRVDGVPGLPCARCASATTLIGAEILGCCRCPFTLVRPVTAGPADPADCPSCNP